MIELKKVNIRRWTRAFAWIAWRRKLLLQIDEAPEARHGPNAVLMLVLSTAFACLSVTFGLQALGLQVAPGGTSDTLAEALIELLQRTIAAAKSVNGLHPDGWAGALLLPIGVVLSSAMMLAWLAQLLGRVRRAQPPRYRAWWLAMAGNLCVLGAVAPVVGAAHVIARWGIPTLRFVGWFDTASFNFMVGLTVALVGFQVWRRRRGQNLSNGIWETFAFAPAIVLLLANVVILPSWAQSHQPAIHARALSNCDVSAHTCTVALTLSDASIFELAPQTTLTLELGTGVDLKQHSTTSIHATWLSDPQLNGLPVQLHDAQLHYARLRFETPRPGDKCPALTTLDAVNGVVPVEANLTITGLILGRNGKSKFHQISQSVEKPVPGEWARTVMMACQSATPTPSGAVSPIPVTSPPIR